MKMNEYESQQLVCIVVNIVIIDSTISNSCLSDVIMHVSCDMFYEIQKKNPTKFSKEMVVVLHIVYI